MKKMSKLVVLFASVLALASCGSNCAESSVTPASNGTDTPAAATASLKNAYTSPAKLTYSNMRPDYNWYTVTFTFQTIETYTDNSYVLSVSSSTYSGLILSENTSEVVQANERNNSLIRYYGTFTEKEDDIDVDTHYLSLSEPTRIIYEGDDTAVPATMTYFLDTDNWTDKMKKDSADVSYTYNAETEKQEATGTKEYATGAEYLAAKKYAAVEATISVGNYTLEYIELSFSK